MRALRIFALFTFALASIGLIGASPAQAANPPSIQIQGLGPYTMTVGGTLDVSIFCSYCTPAAQGTATLVVNGLDAGTTVETGSNYAYVNFTPTAPGTYQLTGRISDPNYANVSVNTITITVSKSSGQPQLLVEQPFSIPMYQGTSVSVFANHDMGFSYGTPQLGYNGPRGTGLVTLSLDGNVISQTNFTQTSPAVDQVEIELPNGISSGTHTLTASYAGDANFDAGTYTTTITTTKLAGLNFPGDFDCPPDPTTNYATCVPTYNVGAPITVYASPGGGQYSVPGRQYQPTGNVTFYQNNAVIGTATLVNGTAAFTTSEPVAGNYQITYGYQGDDIYNASPNTGLYFFKVVDPNATITPTTPTTPVVTTTQDNPQAPAGKSYKVISSNGSVFGSLSSRMYGTIPALTLNKPIVGGASTPDHTGYWLVATDGGIFAYNGAGFFGSTGNIKLNQPIVGMASTPTGNGYWLVASDGGIFAYGDAKFFGSTGSIKLNQPIVGMAATPSGNGYWLVASDGGIFAYGDAAFYGSTGSIKLNKPIVGMASTPSGHGYWLVASDGGIFAYGDASFYGSTGSIKLNKPITGMISTDSGAGYWLVASDGGIFTFGDAQFDGSNVNNGNVVAAIH